MNKQENNLVGWTALCDRRPDLDRPFVGGSFDADGRFATDAYILCRDAAGWIIVQQLNKPYNPEVDDCDFYLFENTEITHWIPLPYAD